MSILASLCSSYKISEIHRRFKLSLEIESSTENQCLTFNSGRNWVAFYISELDNKNKY